MSRTSGQAFAQSYVELHKVHALQLGFLAPEEVQRMAITKIDSERAYDDKGFPVYNGINDPRMGTIDSHNKCITCKGTSQECPGHFAYIELAQPVFHAGLLEFIKKVLKCVCSKCSKVLAFRGQDFKLENYDKQRTDIMKIKKASVRFSRLYKYCESVKKCTEESGGCGEIQPKFFKQGLAIWLESLDEEQDRTVDSKRPIDPKDVLQIFEKISIEDQELMGFNPKYTKPQYMIIKNLAVAPPPVRPSVAMSNTLRSDDDLTYAYNKIIQWNNLLHKGLREGTTKTALDEMRNGLQYYVATLMDNEIQGQPTQKHKNGKPLKAIRARLRGKEGRLRGNLMGKRVDFSARTVITPDPILKLDQLGVPIAIAMNLTIPETVTHDNIDKMRELVARGPNQWPGAKYILRHDDRQIDLNQIRNRSDQHLEPGYRVERHLQNDDYVIFNRQPSLHKMSLMGHRVKVLPYSTFRLNLSVTTPYNADFDGDEMNMHVPQSWETYAEIKEIMAVPRQIVTPQKNSPVMGIVQDALLGIMLLTLKDTFLPIDLVMNILMWIDYNGTLPHPTILKPKPLWTGKQIFSLVIPTINLQKYGAKEKNDWANNKDSNVLIVQGDLMCGVITKGTIGNSSGGMIHIIWKEHGPDATRDFLSNVQLVVNNWLYTNGFTVGVQDIIAKEQTLRDIKLELIHSRQKVDKILLQSQMGKLKSQPGKSMMESFEASVNQKLNQARDKSGNKALEELTSWNRLKAMVFAGSKGSNLNISQIMACVGQQNVEGKRIPFGFNKRTLPHFSKDDFGPESKGFVENCYLNGLTPQEFYFHAMGGREGIIDTAVKTAETGYIQRRLIKALEDVMVKYDGTVRTSKEQVIQFLYGEDGLAGEYCEDIPIELVKQDNATVQAKHKFMDNQLSSTDQELKLSRCMDKENARSIVQDPQIQFTLEEEFKQIMKDRENLRINIIKDFDEPLHIGVNVPRIIWNAKEQFKIRPNSISDLTPDYVIGGLNKLIDNLIVVPAMQIFKNETLIKEANSDGLMLFKIFLRQILSSKQVIQQERLNKNAFDLILGEIKARFDQALVNPGEMVGSIAAQSIGEPATQMTLNTFHNAGISSKNVTLGVPRLKEIINVAKNIKTPSLRIFLKDYLKKDQGQVSKFGMKIEHTTLSDVVKKSGIYYDPDLQHTVIPEDQYLIDLYNDVPEADEEHTENVSSWLLRFELDTEKMQFRSLSMDHISNKLKQNFGNQMSLMKSDDNAEDYVLRIRLSGLSDIEEEKDETVSMYLKQLEEQLLHELTLKGFPEISKVTFSKYNEVLFLPNTGALKVDKDDNKTGDKAPYQVETDGVALQKVLTFDEVNHKKTISNDILEILRVLGIEAVRMSLISELRFVLKTYGIYVNYRHLATLCDIMTQRGILTSITRHGINRGDNGPLRKCSFEETVEILLEAAVFSELDPLSGITENIIMGQLAPYGTGCFDLVIDSDTLRQHAFERQYNDQEDIVAIDDLNPATPVLENITQPGDGQWMGTPIVPATPSQGYYQGGGMSQYTPGATPQYQGNFTPGGGMSPYMSPYAPSPQYQGVMSPNQRTDGMSPMQYMNSPIYQAPDYAPNARTSGGNLGNTAQGPTSYYSPTGSSFANNSSYGMTSGNQGYSPSQALPSSIKSPIYTTTPGGIGSSSGYSPSQQPISQQYSPTGGITRTPIYSPTNNYQQNYSPSYSPTTPAYTNTGAGGRYQSNAGQQMASPRYNVGTSQGSPNNLNQMAMPTPAYPINSANLPNQQQSSNNTNNVPPKYDNIIKKE